MLVRVLSLVLWSSRKANTSVGVFTHIPIHRVRTVVFVSSACHVGLLSQTRGCPTRRIVFDYLSHYYDELCAVQHNSSARNYSRHRDTTRHLPIVGFCSQGERSARHNQAGKPKTSSSSRLGRPAENNCANLVSVQLCTAFAVFSMFLFNTKKATQINSPEHNQTHYYIMLRNGTRFVRPNTAAVQPSLSYNIPCRYYCSVAFSNQSTSSAVGRILFTFAPRIIATLPLSPPGGKRTRFLFAPGAPLHPPYCKNFFHLRISPLDDTSPFTRRLLCCFTPCASFFRCLPVVIFHFL